MHSVRKCFCSACSKYFASDSLFAEHRVKGQCLTTEAMQQRGYASEKRQVRCYVDGKPVMQEQDVWYSVVVREKYQQIKTSIVYRKR